MTISKNLTQIMLYYDLHLVNHQLRLFLPLFCSYLNFNLGWTSLQNSLHSNVLLISGKAGVGKSVRYCSPTIFMFSYEEHYKIMIFYLCYVTVLIALDDCSRVLCTIYPTLFFLID